MSGFAPLPPDRLVQPTTVRWFAAVFGGSGAYAILRYPIAGDVAWEHFPLFIMNKATAMAAVVFVACSYLVGPVLTMHNHDVKLKLVVVKFCGLMGFSLALVHAFFAVMLMNPAYFAKYFLDDGRMNVTGELGMAAGVLALWALAFPAITTLPMMAKELGGVRWKRNQRMGYVCLLLVALHLAVLGLKGWLTPATWPWWIPPISLVAFGAALLPLLVKRRRVQEQETRRAERAR